MKFKTKLITLVVAFLAAISLPCHRKSMRPREIRDLIGQSIREQVDDMEQIKTSSSSLRSAGLTVVLTSISGRTIAKLPVQRQQENVCIATSGMALVEVASWG